MARDSALMRHAADTGESIFSIYSWSEPTLSFGRNQRANGKYDRDRLGGRGVAVVRRPTGGRAILHHREITYSVAAPAGESPSLRDSYARINAILLDALLRLGVKASIAPAVRGVASLAPSAIPCFAEPAEGEIIAGGRKLVGSAQWRNEKTFLQHGSILIDDDQQSIADFSADGDESGARSVIPRPATLHELLGCLPDTGEFAAAVFQSVRGVEQTEGDVMNEEEIRPAALDRVPEFLDEEWTWRR